MTESDAPTVISTSPANSNTSVNKATNITVTFSELMGSTSITTNTDNTSCSGSFQVSTVSNNFSSCVQMTASSPFTSDNETFTVDPSDNLSENTTFKIRVTTGVKDPSGNSMSSDNTTGTGFTTQTGATPTAPIVSGTTPTNDTTPTWSWSAGGGGNGTYRYELDNSDLTSGATTTTSTSYTPGSAISEGSHTLYVQERNAAGNWSSSGSRTIVIDSTAGTANFTAATDNVGTVTGALTNGDTTDDTALVLSGTNGSGSSVMVYNNSTQLGAATVSTTNWSYSATVANGTTYQFNVRETDPAGNTSNATSNFAVTGDTTAPTANFTKANDNVGTVTGDFTSDNTTDDTALVLSGTNEAGSSVKVYNGSTELGAATVSTTSWSYTATVVNGTTHQFNVKETDPAGNTSAATSNLAVTGDTTAPTIIRFTSTTNDGNYILAASVNITATASEDVVSGNTITATLDTGDTVLLTAAANGTTLVGTYTVGAGDNSNDLTVSSFSIGTVTDIAAGNAMASTTVPSTNIASGSAIVIDALAPTARLISCEISSCYGIFERTSITVQSTETGTAYLVKTGGSGADITVTNLASITSADPDLWNRVTISQASTDTTLALADLEEGIYHVYAVDALGNLSTASVGPGGMSGANGSLDIKTE